jgi:hypothetical protein
VEIVRQLIKKNQQAKRELLFASYNQHVGFINMSTISDGRDLNRVFLEAKGSLARFALPILRNNALLTMQSIFMQEAQVGSTHLKFGSPKQSRVKRISRCI